MPYYNNQNRIKQPPIGQKVDTRDSCCKFFPRDDVNNCWQACCNCIHCKQQDLNRNGVCCYDPANTKE